MALITAGVSEVLGACTAISNLVSFFENYKEDWFTASEQYEHEAQNLRRKLDTYGQQLLIHRLPPNSAVTETFEYAESTLRRAELRLKRLYENVNGSGCYSHGWSLYAKLSLMIYPEKLEKTLQKVNAEIDNITKTLQEAAVVSAAIQEADERQGISPVSIDTDDKFYVPIEKSQSAVIKAIEDSEGPSMILLHGGFGKGKSTLAKYVYGLYDKSDKIERKFDKVIMVHCGNRSIPDPSTKKIQILQDYSPTSLGKSSQEEKTRSKARISKAFKDFLSSKKFLVVLDDVSDRDFLYEMYNAGKENKYVKYLITSQMSDICGHFSNDFLPISMGDLTELEAKTILATFVGLKPKEIPPQLQTIAQKILYATEGNPLALACLANHFTYNRNLKDKRAWQDAFTELCKLLDKTECKIVLGPNYDSPPRSVWAAMKLCIDSLQTSDAKVILYLMYACRGESVPEEVLRILYSGIKTVSSTFLNLIGELDSRELVKPKDGTLVPKTYLEDKDGQNEDEHRSTAWSLRPLVKLYMERREMVDKEEIRSKIGELVGDKEISPESRAENEHADRLDSVTQAEQEKIVMALCALYFDGGHSDDIVTDAVNRARIASNLTDSGDGYNDLRRFAVEPLIWLLDQQEEDEQWTLGDVGRVRKVFLKYIFERQLDDDNISWLLYLPDFPSAPFATLVALSKIFSIEEKPLLSENSHNFLQPLVQLLDSSEGEQTMVQEAASYALLNIVWRVSRTEAVSFVLNTPGLLDVLVRSVQISPASSTRWSDAIRENAVYTLAILTYDTDYTQSKLKILNTEGALASLVKALCEDDKPGLQEGAANALGSLTNGGDSEAGLRILKEKGALEGLTKAISRQDQPKLQESAAWAVAQLIYVCGSPVKETVANADGLIEALVNALTEDSRPDLQSAVGTVLSYLFQDPDAKALVRGRESIWESLLSAEFGAAAVTLADHALGRKMIVYSEQAFLLRSRAYIFLGMYSEALSDVDRAIDLQEPVRAKTLCLRAFAQERLGNLESALDDANEAVEVQDPSDRYDLSFVLQERGIMKRMKGDLEGALADLDAGLQAAPKDYELLKHRGYVRYLLKNEEGARADAELAQSFKYPRVDNLDYESAGTCLGVASPPEFLGYKLR